VPAIKCSKVRAHHPNVLIHELSVLSSCIDVALCSLKVKIISTSSLSVGPRVLAKNDLVKANEVCILSLVEKVPGQRREPNLIGVTVFRCCPCVKLDVPEQSVGTRCLHSVESSNETTIGSLLFEFVNSILLWIGKGEIERTRSF
jgi:hypothetical protein